MPSKFAQHHKELNPKTYAPFVKRERLVNLLILSFLALCIAIPVIVGELLK